MAAPLTDQELQLKQRARRRLIGAAALVIMLVVFLPMILDHEPRRVGQDIPVQIPAKEGVPFEPPATHDQAPGGKAAPAVAEVTKGAAESTKGPSEASKGGADGSETPVDKAPQVPAGKPQKSEQGAGSSAPTGVDPAPKPAKSAKPEPSPKKDSYVIQVGVFTDPQKAKQVQVRLAENNIKAYHESLRSESGTRTRVRVGPFSNRLEAEKVREEIKLLGQEAKVVKQ